MDLPPVVRDERRDDRPEKHAEGKRRGGDEHSWLHRRTVRSRGSGQHRQSMPNWRSSATYLGVFPRWVACPRRVGQGVDTSDRRNDLVERAPHRAVLDEMLRAVLASSQGRVVLLAGRRASARPRWRAPSAPSTRARIECSGAAATPCSPRPLGPFLDVAREAGGELERMVSHGARPHDVAMALLAELRGAPALLVLEDLHRADEASLDVLSLLAGRLEDVPVLVVATYRDDELGPAHPLRIVVGELATKDAVTRMRLEPLSAAGVEQLAGFSGADVDDVGDLHRRTGGNPFFVTEVLAAGSDEVPATVRDAVLARAARLSPQARRRSMRPPSSRSAARTGCCRHSPIPLPISSTNACPRAC